MNLTKQDDIYKFQSLMQAGDTVELDVQHHFSDGLYAREFPRQLLRMPE